MHFIKLLVVLPLNKSIEFDENNEKLMGKIMVN